jgi:hemolysin activation/secretion protein
LKNTADLVRRCAMLAALAATSAPLCAQQPPAAPAAEAAVAVDTFRVIGNTLLEQNRIYATLAPFRGRRTLEELRRAAEAVQRLYAEAGFGGVVAFLPPQQGSEPGVVTIRVVEGKVSSVRVLSARFHTDENVRASLPDLQNGQTPRLRRIDTQIELANENPSKRVQVLLRPGNQPGEVAADLTVVDRSPQAFSVSVDDTGNERTGKWRAGLGWQHANVWGIDDVVSLQYQTSLTKPGQVAVASAFYRHPVPGWLMVWDGYIAYSDVDGGTRNTAAGALSINGRGNLAGVRATFLLPRWNEVDHRVSLSLDRREYLNRCDIDGLPNEVCGAAGRDIAVTPLSLDYALRSNTPFSWTLTLTALGNLKTGGSKASAEDFAQQRPEAKQSFGSFRLGASAQTDWSDWQLRARLSLQWTKQALVTGEQFGLGGAVSVRGYEEREVVGDKGAAGSLELSTPEFLTRSTADQPSLRAFWFADGGAAQNNFGAECAAGQTRCPLLSTGLGLTFERQRLQVRLAGAVALKESVFTRKNDKRAHFSANLSF